MSGTGNPPPENLFCHQPKWTDVLIFFLANIVAHAATVPPYPGDTVWDNVEMIVGSIFLPYNGVGRAATKIASGAAWINNPLQKAARAGALCGVGRTSMWRERGEVVKSRDGEKYFPVAFSETPLDKSHPLYKECSRPETVKLTLEKNNPELVNGQTYITAEYAIYQLDGFEVEEFPFGGYTHDKPKLGLSSNHSFAKPLVSIFQIIYASISLYQARGKQITHYGYGAYPFIVIPYIFMSFMNLTASICCPEYPCLFLVESEIMNEAKERGCFFSGAVGRVKLPERELVAVENSNPVGANMEDTGDEPHSVTSLLGPESPGKESMADIKESEEWGNTYDGLGSAFLGRLSVRANNSLSENVSETAAWFLTLSVVAGPFVMVAVLARFQVAQSSFFQRIWLTIWIPLNIVTMICSVWVFSTHQETISKVLKTNNSSDDKFATIFFNVSSCLIFYAPAVLVFWTVGRSIMEYEVCKVID